MNKVKECGRLIELPISPLKLLILNFFVISFDSTIKSIYDHDNNIQESPSEIIKCLSSFYKNLLKYFNITEIYIKK